MRKMFLSLAAVAAMLSAGSLVNRAEAVTLGTPAGLAPAIEDVAVVDQVHCRPRWRHHRATRWHRANGCARHQVHRGHRVYRHHRVYRYHYAPRFYYGPRYRWWNRW